MEKTVSITTWQDDYAEDYMDLSVEWLKQYDLLEPADFAILAHPHEAVLAPGGMIFFARCSSKNIGTISVIPIGDGVYEAAKLCVREPFKRRHIGDALMEAAIAFVKEKGGRKLILFTNSRLYPAICLYKKHGFRETRHEGSAYAESDMRMELELMRQV